MTPDSGYSGQARTSRSPPLGKEILMIQRLRHLILALTVSVGIAMAAVVVAPPANADPTGSSCMDPTIEGTFSKGSVTNAYGLTISVVKFNAVGYTSADCPTTFTDYRYKAAFSYNGRTTSAYHSSIEPVYGYSSGAFVRVGTRIEFPEQTLAFQGYKDVDLAVTSGSKSKFTSTWCRSNEETWDYHYVWFPSTVVTFDTGESDGTPRGRINACP